MGTVTGRAFLGKNNGMDGGKNLRWNRKLGKVESPWWEKLKMCVKLDPITS